ncbi:MAG TPA: LamG domain-containing protein [Nannocystaceae bacterium]|nr:LamG domain-containing protein [Nannocystaceae bacterium]
MRSSARELALLGAIASCRSGAFACEGDDQCDAGDAQGVCQPEGVCSFPDDACASGQRYGDHSGALSGHCVPTGGTGSSSTSVAESSSMSTIDPSIAEGTSSSGSPGTSSGGGEATSSDGGESSSTGGGPDPSLLVWFQFEDELGDGFDNSGALGGVATCADITCPAAIDGPIGQGAQFDGVDDCGTYPFVDALAPDTFTLALWARREVSGSGFDVAFTKPVGDMPYNTWRMTLQYDEMLGDRINVHVGMIDDSGVDSYAPLPLGTWVHFAATWTGEAMTSYVNGELHELVPSTLIEVDDQPLLVGCDDDHVVPLPVNYLEGAIDDVRMYDRVLDDAEIAELAQQGM